LFKVEIGKLQGGGQSDEMRKAVEEEIRLQLCLGGECGGGYIGLINFFFGKGSYCLQHFLNNSHGKSKAELLFLLLHLERNFVWALGS
jgi:hypothetical protein